MKTGFRLVVMFTGSFLVSCGGGRLVSELPPERLPGAVPSAPDERFDPADRPRFVSHPDGDYHLAEPWNYRQEHNATRRYPLFVYLHGSGGSGLPSSLPCFQSDVDLQRYPCFVYVPHTKASWDYDLLIRQIEELESRYRIDSDRIYLVGFSMGGSGSYALANAYFDRTGSLFAGIVRMAGQSETALRDAIVEKTAVWYHVGLADSRLRTRIAASAYSFLRRHRLNRGSAEYRIRVGPPTGPAVTTVLFRDQLEVVRYTRYEAPVGHDISSRPFSDPYLLEWLFSRSLRNHS